jgi:hypothetical protein
LREQTSSREAYTLRAARARDERHFPGKVHRFGPHTGSAFLNSIAEKMTMAKTVRREIMNDPLGRFVCGIISGAGTHFGKPDCTSWHTAASNTMPLEH